MSDDDRVAVKTYVPAHQKEVWVGHADDLGLSTSEFVRTMVQAGRRDFDLPELEATSRHDEPATTAGNEEPPGTQSSASNPGGSGLEDRVVETIRDAGAAPWDDLLAAVTADVEDRLEATLAELQDEGVVRYSGRDGGYVLADA